MSDEMVQLDVDGSVATLTLHRPEQLNAFNRQLHRETIAAFDRIDEDDDIRAVIVTGSGRAFSAGADVSRGGETFAGNNRLTETTDYAIPRDGGGELALRIFECLKPVIGAVNGAAVGMGVTMTLPMDMRLASESARFSFVFGRRGLVTEGASSWFLPRLVGMNTALEWTLTGRFVSASEALAAGFVRSVHPPEELLPAARALALEIAENVAPVSASLTRHMLWRLSAAPHPMDAHRIDSQAIFYRGKHDDTREGVTAFLEKRPPAFPGRVSTDMPPFFPWWDEPRYH